MRTPISSLTVTALSLLTIVTPLVSAAATHIQRSLAHKRTVGSRNNQTKRDGALAGLESLNNALGSLSSSGSSGGPAKAVAAAPPASASPYASPPPATSNTAASSCFPSANFTMPASPPANADNWWCDLDTEYAFVGFSYEVTACEYPILLLKMGYRSSVCSPQAKAHPNFKRNSKI